MKIAKKRSSRKSSTIKLGPDDAAVIVYGDGGHELYLPALKSTDTLTLGAAVASMLTFVLADQKMFDAAHARFLALMEGRAKPVRREGFTTASKKKGKKK